MCYVERAAFHLRTYLILAVQIFKMWNKELYVREQQDAYEFFTSLIDQMDEYLKVMKISIALFPSVIYNTGTVP